MLPYLILLFTVVPLIELFLLVRVAMATSLLFTVLLVIVTGLVGSWLVRRQGLRTLQRIQEELNQGHMPADHFFSGLLILLGGAFLITPGILTDVVGFLLMVPGNRRLLLKYLKRGFEQGMQRGDGQVFFFRTGGATGPEPFERSAMSDRENLFGGQTRNPDEIVVESEKENEEE